MMSTGSLRLELACFSLRACSFTSSCIFTDVLIFAVNLAYASNPCVAVKFMSITFYEFSGSIYLIGIYEKKLSEKVIFFAKFFIF